MQSVIHQLWLHVVVASANSPLLPEEKTSRLAQVVTQLSSEGSISVFMKPTSQAFELMRKANPSISDTPLELVAVELLVQLTGSMVETLVCSTASEDVEMESLMRFTHLVTAAAFSKSVMRRRSFIALGVLSADLDLQTIEPVVDALPTTLPESSSADCREALSVAVCLSLFQLQEPVKVLELALALCMMPIKSLSCGGLRLLLSCLQKITDRNLFEAFEDHFSSDVKRPALFEKAFGLNLTQNHSLGICCIILRASLICGFPDLIHRILLQLIKLYAAKTSSDKIQVSSDLVAPLLMLVASPAKTPDIMEALVLAGLPSHGITKDTAVQHIFSFYKNQDFDQIIVLLSFIATTLHTCGSLEQQIRTLNILSKAANILPEAFTIIVDSHCEYLGDLLLSTKHLPLLHATRAIIVAERGVLSRHGSFKTDSAHEQRVRRSIETRSEILQRMGFAWLLGQSLMSYEEKDIAQHKSSIVNVVISMRG